MAGRSPLDVELERALEAVRADAGLRDLLRAARSWGVQPARLLGRRTVELVAELDDAGRAVRYCAPPWDLADVALVLALEVVEAETCSGCGHPMAESMAKANEFRYTAGLPIRCHACTALGQASDALPDYTPQPQALRFGVHLKPPKTPEAAGV